MSGDQFASAAVLALPSESAARIAVTGRHRSLAYLAFQAMIAASAIATFVTANSLALSETLSRRAVATMEASRLRWPGGVEVPAPLFQNRAMAVWFADRVVLLTEPIAFTSLNALAYSWLFIAGTLLGVNCDGLVIANGRRLAHCGSRAAAKPDGVGCQWPGSDVG